MVLNINLYFIFLKENIFILLFTKTKIILNGDNKIITLVSKAGTAIKPKIPSNGEIVRIAYIGYFKVLKTPKINENIELLKVKKAYNTSQVTNLIEKREIFIGRNIMHPQYS